jgi:CSLREA domain-containing protein/MYXO-CTERM domain-containing protein
MYRKSLLALVVLATLPVTAATDRTIYVSTVEDEDGENASACSLREAIQAATTNRAYGGCIAGQLDIPDQIKLKAATYNIKKSLVINSTMVITGGDAANFDKEDPFTNVYPARSKLETTIQPANSDLIFSLFDSTTSRSSFTINNLILKNGKSNRGGAIRAGGTVDLNRVRITNSSATDVGGAIYLEGSSANLNAADTLFDENKAVRGAVIGMSCLDNVAWTQHSIRFERSSIYANGSTSTQSIIDYCGTAISNINASTIAKNEVGSNGNIIKYAYSNNYPLHPSSTLDLISNTIVENLGDESTATLYYDNVGKLSISDSIIAYNKGKSCKYGVDNVDVAKLTTSQVVANYNALILPKANRSNNDECDLPGHIFTKTDNTGGGSTVVFKDLSSVSFNQILAPLYLGKEGLESEEGLFPAYIPIATNMAKEMLIDQGLGNCSERDQRGLLRINTSLSNTATATNTCDIGAIEVSELKAADLLGVTNTSQVTPISQYEDNIEYYENIYKDKDLDPKLLKRYKQLIDNEKQALQNFKNKRAYRQAYASVLDNSTEQEVLTPEGNSIVSMLKKFGDNVSENYTIVAEAAGRGTDQFIQTREAKDLTVSAEDSNIHCAWEPELKQVVIRRKDNNGIVPATTPSGEYEYCKYTITYNKSSETDLIQSVGYIQARIVNIAPIAKDDEYNLTYGSSQPITLNILANDADDGDGDSTPDMTDYPKSYPSFYQNPESNSYANIKLVTKPTLGKLNFEYEQPCPDNTNTRPEETCYGGKITYTPNNTFSTFNDSFSYKVLDQDRAESNEAAVKIINTATTSDDTRGGGGSVGLFGLLGLFGLAFMRRKMN